MWLLPSPVHFFLLQFVLLLVLLLPSCLTKKKERKERKPSSRGRTPAEPSPCRKPPKKSKKSTTGTTISTQASITKKSSSGQNRSPKIPSKMKSPKQPAPKPIKSKAKSKMEPPKSKLERLPPKFMHAPSNTSLERQAESPMAHFDPAPLVKRLGLNVDQIIAVMTMSPERRDDWWEYVNLDLEEEYKRREKEWKEHDCVKNKKKSRRPKEKEKDGGPAYCEGCYYYAHLKEEVRRMLEDFGDYPRLYVKPEDKKTIEKINAIADKMGGSRQEVDVDRATLEGRQQNIRLRKRKRIAEKQKIERERLKVEEEKKKKEETKQTEKKKEGTKQTAAGGGGGGGGQYESLIDAVGVKKRGGGQEKEGKKKPEAHYESLFNEPTVLTADTQESYENPFDNQ